MHTEGTNCLCDYRTFLLMLYYPCKQANVLLLFINTLSYWDFMNYPTSYSHFLYYSLNGLPSMFWLFYAMGHVDWPITKRKKKLARLPQTSNSYVNIDCLPL